jgi:lipid-A-disaccharide synthase
MGLLEVLPNLRRLAQRMEQTEAALAREKPALLVTIDSPGFTLRLAARAKRLGIPVCHYVAPQVWAWRRGRVRKIARLVDRILCLLPFEPGFFTEAGIPADFVGHPVLESGADAGDAARFRARHGIDAEERVVLVMPGSRRSEVGRMLPVFGATLARLPPGLRPVVPLAGPVEESVRAAAATWSPAPVLVRTLEDKHDAFAAASGGLIKSGTSSLEVAMAGVPMVVGYRVNPVTAMIARRLIEVRFASIVNLLADREIIPEFIQERCTPELLAPALLAAMERPEAQRAGFAEVLGALRPPGGGSAADAAARAVLGMLEGA